VRAGPGFPLQFLKIAEQLIAPQFLRDFRCNPLREITVFG
jgi:hypothetical protein